ncbi:Coagulation factor XIII B chain [Ophiophagus hannah]|uniref:Coagulation factor XIII B chain n=1 Tax=Ophiophagus hannah TaxID=8665 RepID=V8P7T3_OPHHA|nr:Coagulation factor XIII B chain [Ophiophagus hannah]
MKKGKKLSYTCLAGYSAETGSQNGRVNCTNEGWTPVPKCYKKCVQPTLDNGVFSDTKLSYDIWESLKYSCHSGYQTPEGKRDARTCLVPDLLYGHYHTVQRVFSVNDKLRYECMDGYVTARGNTTEEVLCHIRGWSLVPKCTKLECSSPNPVEHGKVYPKKSSYEEGDVLQIICLEERRNKCPPPPQPPNTRLLTNLRTYRQGDMIHYQCEHSFQLNGTGEIRCENGKWTSPPKCIDMGRTLTTENYRTVETGGNCNSPPVVKNSITVTDIVQLASYNPGSFVEYACRPLHIMKGSSTVHCIHGSWTEPPICLEPCLAREEIPANYNLEMKWKLEEEWYFMHGDFIEFVCKPGYVLPPLVSESKLLVQCNDGQLRYPQCISKGLNANCGPPPSIENGVVMSSLTENYEDGSTIQYSCNEYYVLQGSITVFCSRSQWTTPPVCIEPCTLSQEEMAKNNLLLRWSFDNRPYFLHGEFVEFLTTLDFYQIHPLILEHSVRMDNYYIHNALGIKVSQQMQVAYDDLVNLLTEPEIPTTCGPPPAIGNAMLLSNSRQEFLSGESVIYQCYRLYEMEGTPIAKCENGHWRGVPRCVQTCRANQAGMDRNNIQLRWLTKSTSMRASDYWMEFECKPGFRKHPLSSPFMKQCVKGPWVYPRCV